MGFTAAHNRGCFQQGPAGHEPGAGAIVPGSNTAGVTAQPLASIAPRTQEMTGLELSSHGVAASPHTSQGGPDPRPRKSPVSYSPLVRNSPCPRPATQSPSPGIFGTKQKAGPCSGGGCNVWQERLLRPRVTGGGSWSAKEREQPGSTRAPSPTSCRQAVPLFELCFGHPFLDPPNQEQELSHCHQRTLTEKMLRITQAYCL